MKNLLKKSCIVLLMLVIFVGCTQTEAGMPLEREIPIIEINEGTTLEELKDYIIAYEANRVSKENIQEITIVRVVEVNMRWNNCGREIETEEGYVNIVTGPFPLDGCGEYEELEEFELTTYYIPTTIEFLSVNNSYIMTITLDSGEELIFNIEVV